MTVQEALEHRKQNMQQAEQIRQEAKAAGTWGVQQNSTLAFTPPKVVVPEEKKTSTDLMWDRNSQPQKIEETTRAKVKFNQAKKAYDEYVASDEYKQRLEEQERQQKQADIVKLFLPNAAPDLITPKVIRDEKEEQLRAARDQAEAEYNASEDQKVIEHDLEAITGLSEEERRQLEAYAVGRDVDYYDTMNMAQNGFQMGRAQQKAAGLIDKYGQERVDQMANTLSRQNNAQLTQQIAEMGQKHGDEHAVLGSIGSVAANIVGGIMGTMDYMKELGRNDQRFKTLDPNAMGNVGNVYAGAVRGQVQQNIEGDVYDENGELIQDGGMLRGGLSVGYQALMSFLDNVGRAALGGGAIGGAALAATGSFSQTMAEASKRGATPAQAALLATTTAGIEALSEKIPLDNLIRTAKGGTQTVMQMVKTALLQAGIEATTEEISLLGTVLADAAIMQEKSEYQLSITSKIMQGISPEQARDMADKELLDEAVNTALVSMASGGMSSLGGSAVAQYQQNRAEAMANNPAVNKPKNTQQATQTAIENNRARQERMAAEEAAQEAAQPQTESQPVQKTDGELVQEAVAERVREVQRQKQAAEAQTEQATDNSTGNKSIKLYRGYNQSDDPTQKNLTKQQSVYNILGREDPNEIKNLLPLAYYTENEEDARSYADMDVRQMDEYRKNGIYEYRDRVMRGKDVEGLSEEEYADRAAKRSFLALHGREPNAGGRVQRYDYTPGKVLDLTELGDMTNVDAAYKVLADKFGIEPSELDNILTMGNNFENDFPAFALLRNTPRDNLGTKIVDLAKKTGYDSIRYSEGGNSHYAIITDQNGWDSRLQNIAETSHDSAQQADMQMGANNQSTSGEQIKGTGAAEQNFTGKAAYNEVLSEENAQPDRKTDVRSMELPKQDINGGNVSATTANVYGSQNTPDDLAGAMEEPVARGDFSYVRITNDAATQRAQQEIEKAGDWDTARTNFGKDVEIGIAGAEMSARGALILNHAAEVYQQAKDSGDVQAAARAKKEWLTILADVQKLGTNTAQGLQAMKIIRNLMPQDKLQFAQIAVNNMVRDMRLNNAIQIDQQLIAEYENATTDQQRDEVMEKIQQNVADQIPSTLLDKWNALRYTNMLGNLKTTVRNVAGNVGNTAVYRLKDLTGGIIETIANKVTKGKTGRTKSVVVNKKLQKSLDNYYQQVKSTINSGGKYGEGNSASGDFAQGVMDKRRIFKSNSKNETVRKAADFVMAPMEGYRKATNWMMNNDRFGDEAFGKAAFTHAMAGYLQANGVKTEADIRNADPDLIDKAMAYAVKEAQETTFHDNSALANVLGKLKKDAGVVGEGIMPFTKTPANVLTRAEEYSPLGIINTAIKTAQKAAGNTQLAEANGRLGSWAAKGQDITGTDIINSLSKTLTGTGIFALGAILKSNGILNGGPDEDDEQATFDQMNGQQPYSINLPDGTNYTLDWLTPVAMPLFMGAQFMDIAADKDLTFADLEKIFTSIADPMLQMSMLQGMNDSLDNIKYSENNLGQFFINAAVSYLTQGLTNTLLGQLERSTEENRQTTFIDKDSNVPEWMQKQLGKASQKIPGWDYQQIDYKNAWGETEKNEGGLGYNLLSPGYSSKVRKDSVTDEINRLNKAQSESVLPSYIPKTVSYRDSDGTYHENYRLSEEEYQQMAQTQGQSAREILEKMVEHSSYQAMDDDMRATAMKMVYSYAREKAMHETLGTTYSTSWMMGLSKGTEASRILMEVADNELNKALSNIKTARANNYSKENQAAYERELDEVYNSFKGMDNAQKVRIMESATGDTKKYLEVRSKGVTTKQYLDTTAKIDKLRPEPGYTTVRDIQTREAIAKMPGISDKAKDTLMKAYMTDYDPNAKSPQTTELKYDYARQELGLTPSEYPDVYRVQLDGGKKNEKIADWMAMGYTRAEANQFYRLFAATGRTKIDVVEWYNSQ